MNHLQQNAEFLIHSWDIFHMAPLRNSPLAIIRRRGRRRRRRSWRCLINSFLSWSNATFTHGALWSLQLFTLITEEAHLDRQPPSPQRELIGPITCWPWKYISDSRYLTGLQEQHLGSLPSFHTNLTGLTATSYISHNVCSPIGSRVKSSEHKLRQLNIYALGIM